MSGFIQQFCHCSKGLLTITQNSQIHLHILINFGWVDIKVNNLGLFSVCLQITCHTVVETHTHCNEQITLIRHHIRAQISMHTEHTHVQWMVRRQCRKSKQRATSRHLSLLKEFFQFLTCITKFHTLTYQNKRFYRFIDHLGSFLDNVIVHRRNRLIRTNEIHLGRLIIHHGSLCILGKVKNHRSRTSTLCNIESTRYSPSHIFCTTYLITPF